MSVAMVLTRRFYATQSLASNDHAVCIAVQHAHALPNMLQPCRRCTCNHRWCWSGPTQEVWQSRHFLLAAEAQSNASQVIVATALYVADKLCDTQAGMGAAVKALMHAVSDVMRHKVFSTELAAAFPKLQPSALANAPEAARKAVYTVCLLPGEAYVGLQA